MTDPADFDQADADLPGFGTPQPGEGPNELAARRTITALHEWIDERHAVMCQALLTGARQLDRAAASSRAKDYGVANLIAQMRETFLVLMPEQVEGGGEGEWDKLVGEFRRLGGPAALRDQAEPGPTD